MLSHNVHLYTQYLCTNSICAHTRCSNEKTIIFPFSRQEQRVYPRRYTSKTSNLSEDLLPLSEKTRLVWLLKSPALSQQHIYRRICGFSHLQPCWEKWSYRPSKTCKCLTLLHIYLDHTTLYCIYHLGNQLLENNVPTNSHLNWGELELKSPRRCLGNTKR